MLAAMLVYKHAHGVVLKANAELVASMPMEAACEGTLAPPWSAERNAVH